MEAFRSKAARFKYIAVIISTADENEAKDKRKMPENFENILFKRSIEIEENEIPKTTIEIMKYLAGLEIIF